MHFVITRYLDKRAIARAIKQNYKGLPIETSQIKRISELLEEVIEEFECASEKKPLADLICDWVEYLEDKFVNESWIYERERQVFQAVFPDSDFEEIDQVFACARGDIPQKSIYLVYLPTNLISKIGPILEYSLGDHFSSRILLVIKHYLLDFLLTNFKEDRAVPISKIVDKWVIYLYNFVDKKKSYSLLRGYTPEILCALFPDWSLEIKALVVWHKEDHEF